MNHPNLSDGINSNIAESEILGGVWLVEHAEHVTAEIKAQPVLPVGKTLKVQTKNTLYFIEKRGPKEFYISGSEKFCPVATRCNVHGSTWGGSMLKVGFVGRGMHLEFSTDEYRVVTTSEIEEITEGIPE
jgi:hypothetical protein